ncbi:MAG: hypothetical protein K2X29_07185 [Candidatus Obscuribacterales bacterium]|nr:hypothetical protein [Candidatus Obscuribacterales bacterium]
MLRIFALLLLTCVFSQAAFAQWGQLQTPAQSAQSAAEKRKKAQAKFKTTCMDRAMDIPGVPNYPSSRGAQKFIRALKYSSLGQGDNCIVQSFLLKDQPETVREFYSAQLSSGGWLVQPANAANTQILARKRKEGSSCHVVVSKSPEKGWNSMVNVRYVQFQPLAD